MSPHSVLDGDFESQPHAQTNGTSDEPHVNGSGRGSNLNSAPADELHDLVCIGFGPASLAIAVALHDAIDAGKLKRIPKVLFLEKQSKFAWHAGMLLPGAKMQISFIKDLATLRDPRSHFTFLSFLHQQGRLVEFTNLSTFLPARAEYEEYLRWCAGHFGDVVRYGQEGVSVTAEPTSSAEELVSSFRVTSRDVKTGSTTSYRAKKVIVATGGQARIPRFLPADHPKVLHSSQFAHMAPSILQKRDAPYRVAVVGAGQSAAEIFHNVQASYPNSKAYLIMRSEFLKPSDDSPFVNSIFDPSFVDEIYSRPEASRKSLLTGARATNYGVVRLELIEALYEHMYEQRRTLGPDEKLWPHRIMGATEIVGVDTSSSGQIRLKLDSMYGNESENGRGEAVNSHQAGEEIEVDLVVAGTGYRRDAYSDILKQLEHLLPAENNLGSVKVLRDYSVKFGENKVASGSGVWLQGCNENSHGLSDTLLSVLATRSGEIVDSMFGSKSEEA